MIERGTVYTLEEFRHRTKLGEWALRQMKKKGFLVHGAGGRKFVVGDDFIDFLQRTESEKTA